MKQPFFIYWITISCLQPFAFEHKLQTFSRVFLRSKRRVYHFKRPVCHWKRECSRNANAAAILGVTAMFGHGKLHTLVVQSVTLLALFLQTVTWIGGHSIDEVCIVSHVRT